MKSIEHLTLRTIRRSALITSGGSVLAAFSGGCDSVFLLYFLNHYKEFLNIEIAAVHINHGLRGTEADEDERFCKELCELWNVPFYSRAVNVKAHAKAHQFSIEESARILRYEVFDELRLLLGFTFIATAHHINDNAETMIMNISAGTSLRGLRGIPSQRGNIIRPLISLQRSEIETFLREEGIPWRTDSSNTDLAFRRNTVRKEVMPVLRSLLNPSIDEALYNLSRLSDELYEFLFKTYVKPVVEKVQASEQNELIIPLDYFASLPQILCGEILRELLLEKLNYKISIPDLRGCCNIIESQTGSRFRMHGSVLLIRERESIYVIKEKRTEEGKASSSSGERFAGECSITDASEQFALIRPGEAVHFGEQLIRIESVTADDIALTNDPDEEYISADHLQDELCIRRWKNGDRFVPLGMHGEKKISDFLTDEKIPAHKKKGQLVLECKGAILWIIGLRIADSVRILPESAKFFKLTVRNLWIEQ